MCKSLFHVGTLLLTALMTCSPIASAVVQKQQPLLVIRVSFVDTPFVNSESVWADRFFSSNRNSLNAYYDEVSRGNFSVIPAYESQGIVNDGVISVQLSIPHPNTEGDNVTLINNVLKTALSIANTHVNFAYYDTNSDGVIGTKELAIGFVIAGKETAILGLGSGGTWGHAWDIFSYSKDVVHDGVTIETTYFSLGERHAPSSSNTYDATLGILAHEASHALFTLPDFEVAGLSPEGVRLWDLMGTGGSGQFVGSTTQGDSPTHMSAFTKTLAGFADIQVVDAMYEPTTVTLNDTFSADYKVVKIPTLLGQRDIFAELRLIDGYDLGLEPWIGSHAGERGVAIYQAYPLTYSSGEVKHQLRMYYANGEQTNNGWSVPSFGDLFGGNKTSLTPSTSPASSNDIVTGNATGIIIENIAINGSSATMQVRRAPSCTSYSATNAQHVTAQRATTETTGTWFKTTRYYAVGSHADLGTSGYTTVVLKEQPAGYFTKGSSCPSLVAPTILSAATTTVANGLRVDVTASDSNDDIVRVEIELDNSGIWQRAVKNANGDETAFVLEMPSLTGDHLVRVRAVDAANMVSDIVTLQPPGQSNAPNIDTYNVQVNGNTVVISGNASDIDGDLAVVGVEFAPTGTVICNGLAQFTCTLNNVAVGTHSATLMAGDTQGNSSGIITIEFTVAASQQACVAAKNTDHISAGRAHTCGSAYLPQACANGSNNNLGYTASWSNPVTSIKETSVGYWVKVSSCN